MRKMSIVLLLSVALQITGIAVVQNSSVSGVSAQTVTDSSVPTYTEDVTPIRGVCAEPLVLHSDLVIKAERPSLVFNQNDLTKPSGVTVAEMYSLLQSTTYCSWENAQAFVDAESLSPSVNALVLLSITKQESLHGKSKLAREDNNISSWRLKSGRYKHFDSVRQCIHDTAVLLSEQYLTKGTEYYHGTSVEDVELAFYYGITNENKLTKADIPELKDNWAGGVKTITNELVSKGTKLRESEIVQD